MKFFGSLEAQGTAGALLSSSALIPSSSSPQLSRLPRFPLRFLDVSSPSLAVAAAMRSRPTSSQISQQLLV